MTKLSTMAQSVADLLKARGETIGVSESSAGGLISAALVSVPGASAYYLGGTVIYTHDARHGLLAIGDADMARMRASTEPYAALNAARIRERLGAVWALAETGASGPTGNRYGDAAGHACFAVAGPVQATKTLETASPDREANMWRFAAEALTLLEDCIKRAQ